MANIGELKSIIQQHKANILKAPYQERAAMRTTLNSLKEELRAARQERADRLEAKRQEKLDAQAARQARRDEIDRVEAEIVGVIVASGPLGATSSEIELATGHHANAISARLTNLRDDGRIVTDETLRKSDQHPKGEYIYWTLETKPLYVVPFQRDTVSAKSLLSDRIAINVILCNGELTDMEKLFAISEITKPVAFF